MSKYTNKIDDIIAGFRAKVLRRANLRKVSTQWGTVPPVVLPRYKHARHAAFLPCVHRRRGYTLTMDPAQLAGLNDKPINEGSRRNLEDHWLRGTPWAPIRVIAEWFESKEQWRLVELPDYPISQFMFERGVQTVTVQVFEPGDPPAKEERLFAFMHSGIVIDRDRKAEVQSAEVTL